MKTLSDQVAWKITRSLRFIADTFFAKRYGHRAVILETVAGVPGMVSGMWIHLKSLRQAKVGYGPKIRVLLSEAENERMHLMTFIEIAKPNGFERFLIFSAQLIFWHFYLVLYIFFPKTAHRMVGYFEAEAVISYTQYLAHIDANPSLNVPAPKIAIDYWKLSSTARLREVILAVRADEQGHCEVNHAYADEMQ
jgi:ubiquinol oxidase